MTDVKLILLNNNTWKHLIVSKQSIIVNKIIYIR